MSTTVYPVEGHYLNNVPAVEHECDDDFCVESGAFTTDKPKAARVAAKPDEPDKPADSEE